MTVGFERAKRCFDEASDHGEARETAQTLGGWGRFVG